MCLCLAEWLGQGLGLPKQSGCLQEFQLRRLDKIADLSGKIFSACDDRKRQPAEGLRTGDLERLDGNQADQGTYPARQTPKPGTLDWKLGRSL